MSRNELGRRLGVTEAAVSAYEKSEAADRVTIATLRKAAAAMDCELVMAIVPKHGSSFSKLAAARDPALRDLKATEQSMALEGQGSPGAPLG